MTTMTYSNNYTWSPNSQAQLSHSMIVTSPPSAFPNSIDKWPAGESRHHAIASNAHKPSSAINHLCSQCPT